MLLAKLDIKNKHVLIFQKGMNKKKQKKERGKKKQVKKKRFFTSLSTSRQVYLLCRWERHLARFPHFGVIDR